MRAEYDGRQIVGMDLHRHRSVPVRMSEAAPISTGASWRRTRRESAIRRCSDGEVSWRDLRNSQRST
jgi:hypothetical protein